MKSAVIRNGICGSLRGEPCLIGFGDHEAGGALAEELRTVENPCVIRGGGSSLVTATVPFRACINYDPFGGQNTTKTFWG